MPLAPRCAQERGTAMHAGSAADAVRAGSECRRPAPQLIAAAAPATMPDEMLASIIHACIYARMHT